MKSLFSIISFLLLLFVQRVAAQDTLPLISVKNISNNIVISWKNTYGANISTINIQRSRDSIRNFTTIGSVINPLSRENGFVDNKAPAKNLFYRVFVVFEGGTYFFTKSYRPVKDTVIKPIIADVANGNANIPPSETDSFEVPSSSIVIEPVPEPIVVDNTELIPSWKIPKTVKPKGYVASKYVHCNRDNNLELNLPDAKSRKFSMKVFNENDELVFEIKLIREESLVIERYNFLRSGWFFYHLFDDGLLIEKHKFYIPREGKPSPVPLETSRPNMPE